MALLGTFAAADENDGAVTSGSRTTTSGSLVVGFASGWDGTGNVGTATMVISSNQAGTYTEAFENAVGATNDYGMLALAYNIGGARAAGHTLTNTVTNALAAAVSGAEFDGIDAVPTVTVGSVNTATSTSATCSVTVPSGNATVVALVSYLGAATTITVNNGTQATEADENNDRQAHNSAYKLAASGAVTIGWALGASRQWWARAVAFSEPGGGGGDVTARLVGGDLFNGGNLVARIVQ